MFSRILDQIRAFWNRQTTTQRVVLISILVVFIVAVVVLVTWATTPTYAVAFSGISESDAGSIVDLLTTEGISYQLRGSGTILVPSDKVYDVRLSMAKNNLPSDGSVGFELFSGSTLGMTEFTQKVNYQRALEGELERTIGSIDAVQAVRVHIVTPEKALLTSDQSPTTASVTIQQKVSSQLDASQIRAISYLVASSVEGLKPENVTIVDTNGDLLASGTGTDGVSGAINQVDSRRSAEMAVASEIQRKVKSLLDTTLGANRSVVQTTVTLDWTEKQISSQQFDPTPVAVRDQSTVSESYTTNGETVGGIPGAESNLPTGLTAATTTAGSNLVYNRNETSTNYEISSIQTEETVHPGEIKLISLSVLVDGITDQTQLATLENAIAAAAGINRDRGDVISVQSLSFDRSYAEETQKELAASDQTQTIILIAQIVGVLIIAIALLWYIARLLRNLRLASVEVWDPVMKPAYQAAMPAQQDITSLLGAQQMMEEMKLAEEEKPVSLPDLARIVASSKKTTQSPEEEQMQRILSRMAEDNPAGVAEIIQLWLNEDKR